MSRNIGQISEQNQFRAQPNGFGCVQMMKAEDELE
jgi:hypothetical protein